MIAAFCLYSNSNAGRFYVATSLTGVYQQAHNVTGSVVDAQGKPVVAATVTEKGTTNSVMTDENGQFTINVTNGNAVLEITAVGYATIETSVSSRQNVGAIVITAQIGNLDEVVVVGYGTQRRREVTSAIASVKAEDFNKGGARNPMDLVQGKVAGLNITRTQGNNPNSGVSIQLRGVTSLRGSNGPLIVVDGIPGGNLDLLQQDDIESIDVLKDGSAAAIYGTRANGGVIIVTTKKGKAGDPKFEFSTYAQREYVDKLLKNLNADDFRDLIKQGKINADQDFGSNSNLFDEIINRNNLSKYFNLAASGGTSKANYRGSIYYNGAEGIAVRNNRKQFGGRLNFNQTGLNDRLTMQMNIAANINKADLLAGGTADWEPNRNFATDWFEQAVQWNPTASLYDSTGYGGFKQLQAYNNFNPLSRIAYRTSERNQQTLSGDARFILKILKGLNASVFGSYVRDMYNTRGFRSSKDWDQRPATSYAGMSYASKANWLATDQTLESTIDYNTTFADNHTITALAGYSYQYSTWERYFATNNGFSSDAFMDWDLGSGTAINNTKLPRPGMGSRKEDNTLVAFFGRINYAFSNRYFLQALLRREGSSRFGANHKWGNFPAISGGWTVSNEEFMKSLDVINNLKFRVGYGVTGNQGIPNYQSIITLSTGGVYPQGGVFYQTYGAARNPNPDLKWERKAELNFGLDYGILNNRITGSIDVYNRKTTDLLYDYFVPQPPFIQDRLFTNVGSITSKGVELLISALAVSQENFKWNIDFAGNSQTNKLNSLSNQVFKANFLEFGGLPSPGNLGNAIRIFEGSQIGDFYGKRFAGLTADGKWQFYKADGSVAGAGNMSEEDKTVIGNGIPKYQASLSNRFQYKGFDLIIFFRGKFKYDILNTKEMYFGNKKWLPNNLLKSAITTHNDLNDDPQYSDYYLEKGDFVKLDNLTLGYNFNFNSDYIKRCYLFITGRNIATFTKYSGIDPELEDTGFTTGIDGRGFYPRTKSWSIGLNLTF